MISDCFNYLRSDSEVGEEAVVTQWAKKWFGSYLSGISKTTSPGDVRISLAGENPVQLACYRSAEVTTQY